MRILGLSKIEASLVAITALICIGLASPSWARATLDQQPPEFRCGYKAFIVKLVINLTRDANLGEGKRPTFSPLPDVFTTPAETALIDTYVNYAYSLADTNITPTEAERSTYTTCMAATQARAPYGLIRTSSAKPKDGESFVLPPPGDIPPLNHHHEWCHMMGKDAESIINLHANGVPIHGIQSLVEQQDYFAPRHKQATQALVLEFAAIQKSGVDPKQWFKSVTDACMADGSG